MCKVFLWIFDLNYNEEFSFENRWIDYFSKEEIVVIERFKGFIMKDIVVFFWFKLFLYFGMVVFFLNRFVYLE